MASIRVQLMRLEKKQRFLNWFAMQRLFASLTDDELATYERERKLPERSSRPSPLDTLDRKTLLKLWQEHERVFGGRSDLELDYYIKNGAWPEQKGRFHYSIQDGKLCIEWRIEPEEEGAPGGQTRSGK